MEPNRYTDRGLSPFSFSETTGPSLVLLSNPQPVDFLATFLRDDAHADYNCKSEVYWFVSSTVWPRTSWRKSVLNTQISHANPNPQVCSSTNREAEG